MPDDVSRQVTIRSLRWPADRSSLIALDTSFVTDKVYAVELRDRLVGLTVVPL